MFNQCWYNATVTYYTCIYSSYTNPLNQFPDHIMESRNVFVMTEHNQEDIHDEKDPV